MCYVEIRVQCKFRVQYTILSLKRRKCTSYISEIYPALINMRGPLLLNFIEVTKFTLQTVHGQLSDNSKIPDNTKTLYSSLASGIRFLVAPPHQGLFLAPVAVLCHSP
jgi:hypothetical protein